MHINKNFSIVRYPPTDNSSLRAWSAADEYVLKWIEENKPDIENIVIANDRFGYLTCCLNKFNPIIIIDNKSQEKSIDQNLALNSIKFTRENRITPFDEIPRKTSLGIIHIPKSIELFSFYLQQIFDSLNQNGTVICGFMTRHFTPELLNIAENFFEVVEQSLAWKKSRVLVLKGKKDVAQQKNINTIPYTFKNGFKQDIKQYPGVFSSNHIDYATQFLLQHLEIQEDEETILDLASGNGIIARSIQLEKPEADIHLADDSRLAIESSKLNLDRNNSHFHWNDTLDDIDVEFDLVVSNPPFHFAHEVNTEVTVDLFREVAGHLKPGGRFLCVANQHLGYTSHLKKFFTASRVLAKNDKFVVYESRMA